MPTPVKAYAELAARLGDVDPDDPEAVQRWYEEELPKLPPEQVAECLETLLAADGKSPVVPGGTPRYPRAVPLPSLKDAPPARAPTLARLWRYWYARWTRRRRGKV